MVYTLDIDKLSKLNLSMVIDCNKYTGMGFEMVLGPHHLGGGGWGWSLHARGVATVVFDLEEAEVGTVCSSNTLLSFAVPCSAVGVLPITPFIMCMRVLSMDCIPRQPL